MAGIQKWTGREVRALREALRMSSRDFAGRLGLSDRAVSKWESPTKPTTPRADSQAILDTMLAQASDEQRARFEKILGINSAEASEPIINEGEKSVIADSGAECREVSLTLRRDFLGLGGAMAAANLSNLLENELNRMHITLSRGSVNDERLAYLEQRADDLGVQVASAAPMIALQSALTTLAGVRSLLDERQPARYQRRLVEVSAKLSLVIGVEAFQFGQARQAHEWHKAAQYAASDAGAEHLADIALAQQSFVPLYAGNPREVVRLISARLEGNIPPSPAVAQLWGIKARAHATLGEKYNFKQSIENGRRCLENSDPELIGPGILSFHPANLAFYETTGAVSLNDLDNSLDAASRALALFSATESYDRALVGLERACALAKAGEIAEACHAAKAVVVDPGTYYCTPIREYARKFTEEIRSVQSPDTREWRETLAAVREAHSQQGQFSFSRS